MDPSRCQGHALCVANAGEFFDLDEVDSRAFVLMAEVPAEHVGPAQDAASGCPERAITVTQ